MIENIKLERMSKEEVAAYFQMLHHQLLGETAKIYGERTGQQVLEARFQCRAAHSSDNFQLFL
jgi:hypothetical protein